MKKIKERNLNHLTKCLVDYDLNDNLLGFSNIYTQADINKRIIRVIGENQVIENGKVKYIKTVIYSLTSKRGKFMSRDVLFKTFQDLSLIAPYHTQLKNMKKIEEIENNQVKTCFNLINYFLENEIIKI